MTYIIVTQRNRTVGMITFDTQNEKDSKVNYMKTEARMYLFMRIFIFFIIPTLCLLGLFLNTNALIVYSNMFFGVFLVSFIGVFMMIIYYLNKLHKYEYETNIQQLRLLFILLIFCQISNIVIANLSSSNDYYFGK